MPSLFSKLRSLTTHPSSAAAPKDHQNQPLLAQQSQPQPPDWTARRTFSISPKLRTFFEPQTPIKNLSPGTPATPGNLGPLGVLESPESAYSGVVALPFGVEIVRRVRKGQVKLVDVGAGERSGYSSACVGTQTAREPDGETVEDYGASARIVLERSGWAVLHSGDAGILFMGGGVALVRDGENDGYESGGRMRLRDRDDSLANCSLPLTGNLLLQLRAAIAASTALQACQVHTARELTALDSYQESLRKRKETLKERLEGFKGVRGYELADEKSAVDKELVRVWEASIETMNQRLKSEELLEDEREAFERVARAVLEGLAVGLGDVR